MERSIDLRESAARCLKLSRSNLSLDDVAFLETLAAALIRDAEQSESAETGRWAGQYTASQAAVASRAAAVVAPVPSGANYADAQPSVAINRLAELELDTSTDRRRPGRRDHASLALIPLLREESSERLSFEPADDSFDSLRGSRGIIIWASVSAAIWLSLGFWIGGLQR
jgi:hypothetical protein